MPQVPRVSGREVIRALERAGWYVHRVRGSHHIVKAPDGRRTSVPVHGNRTLPIGTLEGIIDEAEMTVEEFAAMLRGKRP
ncbi:MAG: type II toxin-antitoxin system HicA family toxin [Thermomicrobiales bacterium]